VFEDQTGKVLTMETFRETIRDLLLEKEKFIIRQRFMDFKPRELRTVLISTHPELEKETTNTTKVEDQIEQIVKKVKSGKSKA
jgi:hypothetical protein